MDKDRDRPAPRRDPGPAREAPGFVAPGKTTLTSKLPASPGRAVQRQPSAPSPGPAPGPRRSAWDQTMDPAMDAAFRGLTALQGATDPSGASGAATPAAPGAASGPAPGAIDSPQPGIDKPGFIDNDDGANIRTGPAELHGIALTPRPLPPTTRVFVTGIQPGDTAERLAVQEFAAAVRDGQDLRYYENVLLSVNRAKGRAGVQGTFQRPNVLGGGANDVQLEAGRRIWLVSPRYARALAGEVPDGSLTGGLYGKGKRALGHIDDLVHSVTDSPRHFGVVAGEYAEAILDHLPEIIGITAGFIMAESLSAFLAATPTGVGQLAAVLIQLGLAAFGASVAVEACGQALEHGKQWLTLAWTAHGDEARLGAASQHFLKMLVSIAMAALSIAGVRANVGKGLQVASAIRIQPPTLGAPAMATAGGGVAGGPALTPGSITSAGPVHLGKPSLMSATGAGAGKDRRGGRVRHGGGIKQIEEIARKYKMTQEQRRAFGDYVEHEKLMSGRGGADNFTWSELQQLAEEFLHHGGR
jgi:hypothetical protein